MSLRWTSAARDRFLAALRLSGNVSAAARMVGLSRRRAYDLRRSDAEFAAAWEDAEQEAVDLLEAEARRRAIEGLEEPLVGGGRLIRDDAGVVVTVRRYNDRLLEFLLKAHRPEKYKDKPELQSKDGPSAASMPAVVVTIAADPAAACAPGAGADDDGD